MKQTIILVAALILFVGVGVSSLVNRDNKIKFQKVELQSKQAEIQQLELDFQSLTKRQQEVDATNQQEIEKLNKEKEELLKRQQELEAQLSAKREAQRLASQKIQSTASVTATASAATGSSCEQWMQQAGIPITHATQTLILKESGCRVNAVNPSSGACGIPQAYPCSKLPCPLNESGAVCQLQWMDNYVKGRYGNWDNALSTWYSRCGGPQGCWY